MLKRRLLSLVLAAACGVLPARAIAQGFAENDRAWVPAKNAGSIEGQVISVDYQRSTLTIRTATHNQLIVVVPPSANILDSSNGFHTIADITRGTHLLILMSQREQTYTAQIIRLK